MHVLVSKILRNKFGHYKLDSVQGKKTDCFFGYKRYDWPPEMMKWYEPSFTFSIYVMVLVRFVIIEGCRISCKIDEDQNKGNIWKHWMERHLVSEHVRQVRRDNMP